MVGLTLSGTDLAAEVKADLKAQVEELQNNDPSFKPGLVIVQVITLISRPRDPLSGGRSEVARTAMSTSE